MDYQGLYNRGLNRNYGVPTGVDEGGVAPLVVPKDGPGAGVYVPDCNECMAALGLPALSHLYECQDEGGNAVDSIGGINLAPAGNPTLPGYQASITDWVRKGLIFAQGNSSRFTMAAMFGPNPATESVLWLAYMRFNTVAATRQMGGIAMGSGGGRLQIRESTAGLAVLDVNGVTTNMTGQDHRGLVRPFALSISKPSNLCTLRTSMGVVTDATNGGSVADAECGVGSNPGGVTGSHEVVWLGIFRGAAADTAIAAGAGLLTSLGW